MGINYAEMKRYSEIDANRLHSEITEALSKKELRPEEFSIRELAEALVPDGREWVNSLNPRFGGLTLLESAAVKTSQFSNITGQIVYSKIMEGFMAEAFVFSKLVDTIPTMFDGEKIPGVTELGDQAEIVGEGNPYPHAGLGEDYIETPKTTKRGFIVPVTKEAIFFDRTNLILRRASAVGESLGLNKEKRIIDCVIDENSTAHRYKWRGTVIATYGDNSGTHTWDNQAASNALVDWTDIDAAEQLLAAMTDPNTGEPITVMADTLVVCPELLHTAHRIVNATQIMMHAGGYATSGNLSQTVAPNSVGNLPGFSTPYQVVSSRLLAARLATNTDWFLGNIRKAFAYMENWPVTVSQAAQNSEAEFTQDIVLRFKASERGAAATLEPRYVVKSAA